MHSPLRILRKSQGKTLSEVAVAIHLDVGNLSRIERGLQVASLDVAERLAIFFHGEITELEILYPHRFQTDSKTLSATPAVAKPQ
ncbi:helix-turn-helix transcriptional regulator [Pantoea brenneri]|uniref:helix-turn-helix domain-containing protein n=1 Tax=Pantoea TaxID=53335 RepID=UPI002446E56B|nr:MULTISPECIES: helix-turn-helix transcriptional regulator [Pantoea]MDH2121632.1 helix-turn-helix transcriptional regulator [Pantoea brenneri]